MKKKQRTGGSYTSKILKIQLQESWFTHIWHLLDRSVQSFLIHRSSPGRYIQTGKSQARKEHGDKNVLVLIEKIQINPDLICLYANADFVGFGLPRRYNPY